MMTSLSQLPYSTGGGGTGQGEIRNFIESLFMAGIKREVPWANQATKRLEVNSRERADESANKYVA